MSSLQGIDFNEDNIDYLINEIYYSYQFMYAKAKAKDLYFVKEKHHLLVELYKRVEYSNFKLRSKAAALVKISQLYSCFQEEIILRPDSVMQDIFSRLSNEYAQKMRDSVGNNFALIPLQSGHNSHVDEKLLLFTSDKIDKISVKWMHGTPLLLYLYAWDYKDSEIKLLNYEHGVDVSVKDKINCDLLWAFFNSNPTNGELELKALDGGIIRGKGYDRREIVLTTFKGKEYPLKRRSTDPFYLQNIFLLSSNALLFSYKNYFEIVDFSDYEAPVICFTSEQFMEDIVQIKTTCCDAESEVYMPDYDLIRNTVVCIQFKTKIQVFCFDKLNKTVNYIGVFQVSSIYNFFIDTSFMPSAILANNQVNIVNSSVEVVRMVLISEEHMYYNGSSADITDSLKIKVITCFKDGQSQESDVKQSIDFLLRQAVVNDKVRIFGLASNTLLFGIKHGDSEKYRFICAFDTKFNHVIMKTDHTDVSQHSYQKTRVISAWDTVMLAFYGSKRICLIDINNSRMLLGSFTKEIISLNLIGSTLILGFYNEMRSIKLNRWLETVAKPAARIEDTDELLSNEKKLTCPLDKTNKQHFLKEPVMLECGGSVCKTCLDDYIYLSQLSEDPESEAVVIECPVKSCDLNHRVSSMLNSPSNEDLKTLFDESMSSIFGNLVSRFYSGYQKIRDTANSVFQYHEQEIDIRLESMKIEVDQIAETLEKSIVSAQLEAGFNSLEAKILMICEASLYSSQNCIDKYEDIYRKIKKWQFTLKINDERIERSCFGRVLQKPLLEDKSLHIKHFENESEEPLEIESVYGFIDEKHVLIKQLIQNSWFLTVHNVVTRENVIHIDADLLVFNDSLIIVSSNANIEFYCPSRTSDRLDIHKIDYSVPSVDGVRYQVTSNDERRFITSVFDVRRHCFKVEIHQVNGNQVESLKEFSIVLPSESRYNEGIWLKLGEVLLMEAGREEEREWTETFANLQLKTSFCVTNQNNYLVYVSISSSDSRHINFEIHCVNVGIKWFRIRTIEVVNYLSDFDNKPLANIQPLKNKDDFIVFCGSYFSHFKITDGVIAEYPLNYDRSLVDKVYVSNDRFIRISVNSARKCVVYDTRTMRVNDAIGNVYGLASNSKYLIVASPGKRKYYTPVSIKVIRIDDRNTVYEFPFVIRQHSYHDYEDSRNLKANEKYVCVQSADNKLFTFMIHDRD